MTYQKQNQTHDDDNVDEASSLLTIVTASPSSSSCSFGPGGGVPARRKKNSIPIRAVITTCVLLGTLAGIYSGGSGSSSNNTHRTDGTSEALLLGQNQAALEVYEPYPDLPGPNYDPYGNPGIALVPPMVYDPSTDYCFKDIHTGAPKNLYCWYPIDRFPYPRGQWRRIGGPGACDDIQVRIANKAVCDGDCGDRCIRTI